MTVSFSIAESRPKEECSICFVALTGNIVGDQNGHFFHKECLEEWKGVSKTCPLCRNEIVEELPRYPRNALSYSLLSSFAFLCMTSSYMALDCAVENGPLSIGAGLSLMGIPIAGVVAGVAAGTITTLVSSNTGVMGKIKNITASGVATVVTVYTASQQLPWIKC